MMGDKTNSRWAVYMFRESVEMEDESISRMSICMDEWIGLD